MPAEDPELTRAEALRQVMLGLLDGNGFAAIATAKKQIAKAVVRPRWRVA